jgi:DNA-binding NtrC family response regulator
VTPAPIGLTDLFYANSHERARSAFGFYPWSGETKTALSRFGKPPHLLLTGDSGTGKTMIASFIRRVLQDDATHSSGYYAKFGSADDTVPEMPFVVVNCASLTFANVVHLLHGSDPTTWSEAILVGDFVRGSYGVIFFDELGDLTYDVQRSLLMFLEDRVVRPHGMSPFPSFARIVAATNRDLTAMVRRGEFRHDLLARFARQVEVPSLARRGERDRQRLALYAAANPSVNKNDAQTSSRPVSHISDAAMKRLGEYDYPDGNYRDLEATVHRAIESAMRRGSRVIGLEDVRLPGAEFTSERARLVVDLAPDAEVSGRSVAVARPEELERLAVATGRPMLREAATGSLYLPDGDIVYAWKGGRATGESGSAMGDTGDEGAGK